jgi:hypothetical protein
MSIEENKTTVRSLIDGLFTHGDLGAVDNYLATDFVNHDPPFGVSADREGMRAAAQMVRKSVPGLAQRPAHACRSGRHRG